MKIDAINLCVCLFVERRKLFQSANLQSNIRGALKFRAMPKYLHCDYHNYCGKSKQNGKRVKFKAAVPQQGGTLSSSRRSGSKFDRKSWESEMNRESKTLSQLPCYICSKRKEDVQQIVRVSPLAGASIKTMLDTVVMLLS